MKRKQLDAVGGFYAGLFNGITTAYEGKDMYTQGHTSRISEMAEGIARAMKLSSDDIELLKIAALVHDIGNVGISERILNKNGQINQMEYAVVCSHSQLGADILGGVDGLNEITDIVKHHHERWDGKGYPDGISGKAIPMASRILSVCESIDAMLSFRPYRKAMLVTDCKNEIAKNAGVMYDADVVKALLNNWESIVSRVKFN
jgi:putative nucleotidyltransferase with HDIG domain